MSKQHHDDGPKHEHGGADQFDIDVRLGAATPEQNTNQTQDCNPFATQETCNTNCPATCLPTCYNTCPDTCYNTCAHTCPPTCQLQCIDTQWICAPTNQCIGTKGPTCDQTCYTCCSMC